MKWTYTRKITDPDLGTIAEVAGVAAVPSQEFKDALGNFNTTHKNSTVCPEEKAEKNKGQKNIVPGHAKVLPNSPHPGQSTQIEWDVINSSGVPLGPVDWQMLLKNQFGTSIAASGTIAFIDYFEKVQVTGFVPPVSPGYKDTVHIVLDPLNHLPEYDENDNTATLIRNDQGISAVQPGAPPAGLAVSPNPFRSRTAFSLMLRQAGTATAAVFDAAGNRVRGLIAERLEAGPCSIVWDGRDGAGRRVAAGNYLVRVEQAGWVRAAKVVLLK